MTGVQTCALPLWKSSFFFLSKIQHMLFEIYSPLIVMYFENINWPNVGLKWLFPWFFVSIWILDIVYIIWWSMMRWPLREFQKKKTPKSTLRLYQERLFLFLALILSACIITHSLIHEVTTLIEKLFKFRERHLSVQIICSIKKGF